VSFIFLFVAKVGVALLFLKNAIALRKVAKILLDLVYDLFEKQIRKPILVNFCALFFLGESIGEFEMHSSPTASVYFMLILEVVVSSTKTGSATRIAFFAPHRERANFRVRRSQSGRWRT
jgi:hypothetical protein